MSQDKVKTYEEAESTKNLQDHLVPALILLIFNRVSCELPKQIRKKLLFGLAYTTHEINKCTPHRFMKTHCCMQKNRFTKKINNEDLCINSWKRSK